MARENGVDNLSLAELLKLQERIQVAIAERRTTGAREIKEQMHAMAQKSGFSLDELFGDKRKGKRGASVVKYRNPKDASQTWTGRGRKPNWLVDALKKGGKIDTFSV